jgi:hypothetical protein
VHAIVGIRRSARDEAWSFVFRRGVAPAYLHTNATFGAGVDDIRTQLSEMLAGAMNVGEVARHHLEIGELLTDVSAANVLAMVHQRATPDQLRHRKLASCDGRKGGHPTRLDNQQPPGLLSTVATGLELDRRSTRGLVCVGSRPRKPGHSGSRSTPTSHHPAQPATIALLVWQSGGA